jgi:hypothetical protein
MTGRLLDAAEHHGPFCTCRKHCYEASGEVLVAWHLNMAIERIQELTGPSAPPRSS